MAESWGPMGGGLVSDHPCYNQEVHGPYELFDLGPFPLEEGGTLRGCQLAYATVGELSAAQGQRHSPAALVCRDVQAPRAGLRRPRPRAGSGQVLHHPGQPVRQRAFNLTPQHPSSLRQGPLPTGRHRRRRAGPGATRARAVRPGAAGAGGWHLDGAQQTYEWAVRFPDMVKRAAPIAGTAKTTPHGLLYVETFSEAIRSDPAWRDGMPPPTRCISGCAGTPACGG